MSPILDLQQRITERGRIRLGTKVSGTSKTGKAFTRPAKSETFLLSSHDRTVVDVAAAEWDTCGTVEEFDAGWRVDTGRTELDVIIPPAMMAFSQWLELWGKGYCSRRCDGQRETISDGPCQCDPDPRARECKTTTRLSVMLPDLPGFGLWRVESHGYYAAAEIKGAVDAVSFLAPNTLVRGRLIAAAREVVRFDRDGKPQTNKFVVPVLDLPDVRLRELIASDGGVGVAIESPARGGLSPVPQAALPESSSLSVAEQISQTREAPRRRSNAAAVLPPTGLAPGSSGWGEPVPPPPPAPSPGVSQAGEGTPEGVPSGDRGSASSPAPSPAATDRPGGEGARTGNDGDPAAEAAVGPRPPTPSVPGPGRLKALLAALPGIGEGRCLKQCRDIATQLGEPLPNSFDEITLTLAEEFAASHGKTLPDAAAQAGPLTEPQRKYMFAVYNRVYGGDLAHRDRAHNQRKADISRLTSGRTDSSGELTPDEAKALMDHVASLDPQGAQA